MSIPPSSVRDDAGSRDATVRFEDRVAGMRIGNEQPAPPQHGGSAAAAAAADDDDDDDDDDFSYLDAAAREKLQRQLQKRDERTAKRLKTELEQTKAALEQVKAVVVQQGAALEQTKAERDQTKAELVQTKTELERRRQLDLERRNKLLEKAFPPLGNHVASTTGPAQNESHGLALVVEKPFAPFSDESAPPGTPWLVPPDAGSTLWQMLAAAKSSNVGNWSSESDIHRFVSLGLFDEVNLSGLSHVVSLSNEISIFNPSTNERQRPDIWVLRTQSGHPLGVCEVKKPAGSNKLSALSDSILAGQIFDYLLIPRSFFGVKFVFGIITTYEEWRICWLPDCDAGAMETDAYAYEKLAVEMELRSDAPSVRTIHATKIYRHDDPELVRLLAHLMHKMYRTQFDAAPELVKAQQRYPLFTDDSWNWTPITEEAFLLSYVMPHANTKNFYLLQDYHGGADGLVWLGASAAGNLAVVKFSTLRGTLKERTDSLEAEAQVWNSVWGARARVITLCKRPVLVMPFAFHAHLASASGAAGGAAQKDVVFKGPNNWTSALSDADLSARASARPSGNVVAEDPQVLPALAAVLRDRDSAPAEKIAEAAIRSMLEHGLVHDDLCWRHVALLPTCDAKGAWKLTPILIDLTRVRPLVPLGVSDVTAAAAVAPAAAAAAAVAPAAAAVAPAAAAASPAAAAASPAAAAAASLVGVTPGKTAPTLSAPIDMKALHSAMTALEPAELQRLKEAEVARAMQVLRQELQRGSSSRSSPRRKFRYADIVEQVAAASASLAKE